MVGNGIVLQLLCILGTLLPRVRRARCHCSNKTYFSLRYQRMFESLMKTMVCGPKGFLGTAFLKAIPSAIPSQVDICDLEQVGDALDRHWPDVVINCAGKTGQPNIDWCETNRLVTAQANITGPLVLLGECMARDIFLAHIGSGCIFEGDNQGCGFSVTRPATEAVTIRERKSVPILC